MAYHLIAPVSAYHLIAPVSKVMTAIAGIWNVFGMMAGSQMVL